MSLAIALLCFLGLLAMAWASYLHDPHLFMAVAALWCLFGLLVNRWMLAPAYADDAKAWPLWFWSSLGCWAWPVGAFCGLILRVAPAETSRPSS